VSEDLLIRPLYTGTWKEQRPIAVFTPVYISIRDEFVDSHIHRLVHVFMIGIPRTVTGTTGVKSAIRIPVAEEKMDERKVWR
jgi:hypothetical protein